MIRNAVTRQCNDRKAVNFFVTDLFSLHPIKIFFDLDKSIFFSVWDVYTFEKIRKHFVIYHSVTNLLCRFMITWGVGAINIEVCLRNPDVNKENNRIQFIQVWSRNTEKVVHSFFRQLGWSWFCGQLCAWSDSAWTWRSSGIPHTWTMVLSPLFGYFCATWGVFSG